MSFPSRKRDGQPKEQEHPELDYDDPTRDALDITEEHTRSRASAAFSVEDIARVVHAANREIQVITGDPVPSAPWESTPEDIREVALAGVRGALAGETPEESHATWCRNMAAGGWRRGEFKDPAAKIHPCLVPYGQLPGAQRVKDAVFTAIVRAMSGMDVPLSRDQLAAMAEDRERTELDAEDMAAQGWDEDGQHARDMAAEDGGFDDCEPAL